MKYETKITINAPLDQVIAKLDNPENMKHWQEGLQSYELVGGLEPGSPGAKMILHYTLNGRDMVLTETVLKNNFPHYFEASYTTKGVYNIQYNHFKATTPNKTLWICENEFRFKGFAMKAVGFLMGSTFKKQSMKFLKSFKAFVENGTSVSSSQ